MDGLFPMLVWRGSQGLSILIAIFWLWALVDCIVKEPSEGNDKIVWTIFIIFVPFVGALLYYFVRRPERIKTFGS